MPEPKQVFIENTSVSNVTIFTKANPVIIEPERIYQPTLSRMTYEQFWQSGYDEDYGKIRRLHRSGILIITITDISGVESIVTPSQANTATAGPRSLTLIKVTP